MRDLLNAGQRASAGRIGYTEIVSGAEGIKPQQGAADAIVFAPSQMALRMLRSSPHMFSVGAALTVTLRNDRGSVTGCGRLQRPGS